MSGKNIFNAYYDAPYRIFVKIDLLCVFKFFTLKTINYCTGTGAGGGGGVATEHAVIMLSFKAQYRVFHVREPFKSLFFLSLLPIYILYPYMEKPMSCMIVTFWTLLMFGWLYLTNRNKANN